MESGVLEGETTAIVSPAFNDAGISKGCWALTPSLPTVLSTATNAKRHKSPFFIELMATKLKRIFEMNKYIRVD